MISDDLAKIGIKLEDEKYVKQLRKKEFKDIVNEKVRRKAVEDMNKLKETHSKVKEVMACK